MRLLPVDEIQIDLPIVNDSGGAERAERCDAAANRARILAVAEQLMSVRGVAEVTMADIARAAGVGQGTLYRRFANKGELSLALMDRQFREFQDTVMRQINWMVGARAARLGQLEWVLESLIGFAEKHSALLCEAERGGVDVPNAGPQAPPMMWQYLTIRGLLQAAVDAGEVSRETDVPVTADMLLAPLHPSTFSFYRRARGYSIERINAALRRIVGHLPR
ncbi:MAG TPA: helix-turn-helix domain-containing protein [Thermoflexales bacterium]|jgi:AcrR family transcriptional regulator|nr:helix-turn-helix domain-containing protein [Thermoflexales bacterium]HQX11929.1 helix-turn-helix domain-containing protein [Thermoflexales bacterium]HQY25744.1 helix-turn-helix domain-containing protein [Thermoflexales bacterium]HQZ53002.1 helix-turn-helix domain-containing protein [Thermoflexales bacterium]HRA54842.1 helix-turn-helix domain-containing protein [Thermoflexales bacterium]